jgi:hypothetical protein
VADDQFVATDEDVALAITLTATDADGDELSFRIDTSPVHGSLTGTPPEVTYTPDADYNGDDSFTFLANDGTTDSNVATVSIAVRSVNDPPVAYSQSVSTDEDISLAVTLTASDPEGSPLIYSVLSGPLYGRLSGTRPNLTYRPEADYNGNDSFTFRANDGTMDSNLATVAITVRPVNDVPVADAQMVPTIEDTIVGITLTASDVDGDELSYHVVSSPTYGLLTGTPPVLTYTPDANFYGDDSLAFLASDAISDSNVATVSITVASDNDPPVADSQSVTTMEEMPLEITLTGEDIDGDPLTYSIVTGPWHGRRIFVPPNKVTYTPTTNYYGSDAIIFMVDDRYGFTDTATVSIEVMNVNDPPQAFPDSATIVEDTGANVIPVRDNDKFEPDPFEMLTITVVSQGHDGRVAIIDSGLGLTYTPDENYYGPDLFAYTIDDGHGATDTAMVSVTVTNDPDDPVADAGDDQWVETSIPGEPVTVTLDGSSSDDADNDLLMYIWEQIDGDSVDLFPEPPLTATVTFAAPGDPDVLRFRLHVTDDPQPPYEWFSDRVTITIANRPPIADAGPDQSVDTGDDPVYLSGSGRDDDGDLPLSYKWVQMPPGPYVVLRPNPRVASPVFTAPGELCALRFRLEVTDGWGAIGTDDVFVDVSNQPPAADAGDDQGVAISSLVTLDGSGSSDYEDGVPMTYTWKQMGGTPVLLSDPITVTTTFTAPPDRGVLTFTLSVTDSLRRPSEPPSDEVVITVTHPPIASAGPDRTVLPGVPIILDGSRSFDPDRNTPLSYYWSQTGGLTVTLSATNTKVVTFDAPGEETVLAFTLYVTDSLGVPTVKPDEVVIDVRKARVYLPNVMYIPSPDLVVESFEASADTVRVVVANQGTTPVLSSFYVLVYVNPTRAPTAVNQVWFGKDGLGGQGIAWAITETAKLSQLVPGGSLTLDADSGNDDSVRDDVKWNLAANARLYAQVDAYNPSLTDYGYVREIHEISGAPYNNIAGPIYPTAAMGAGVAGLIVERGARGGSSHLPLGP